jgi:hypothetical protein
VAFSIEGAEALKWDDAKLAKKLRRLGVPSDTITHLLTKVRRDVPGVVQLIIDGKPKQVAVINP